MHKSYFFLVFLFILNSCTQKPLNNEGPKLIRLEVSADVLPISSFASSVDYLELKLSDTGKSLGEILSIKKIGDDWLVKHRLSGKISFMRFSRNGEFITELAGGNDNKIKNSSDIIQYENGYAVLAEDGIHLISKEGKYLRLLSKTKGDGTCFFEAGKSFYILNEKTDDGLLIITDSEKSLKKKSDVLSDRIQHLMYTSVETFGKDQIHFYSVLNDTVFSWNKDQKQAVAVFSGDGIPTFAQLYKNMKGLAEKESLDYMRETDHVFLRKYLENKDFMYLTFWEGSNSTTAIVNKKSGEILYFGQGVNDIDGGVWDKVFFLTSKNELVIPITAYKVGGHKILNKKEREFTRLQGKIAVSGNPVLMLCKLR